MWKQRTQQRIGFRVAAVLLLVWFVVGGLKVGQALAAESSPGIQVYKVGTGDTLWLLSQRYGTSISNLKALNSIPGDLLQPGQSLYLPVTIQAQGIVYRVQAGDTLYLISQRVNRTIDAIKLASGLQGDALYRGQTLLLPLAREGATPYRVQPGDSLYLIAKKFNIGMDKLAAYNALPSLELFAGQVLEIPPAPPVIPETPPPVDPEPTPPPANVTLYRVGPGDTLSVIAIRYQTSADAITRTNRLNSDILMPGQPLYIPVGSKEPVQVDGPRGEQRPGFGEFLEWEWARWIYNVQAIATVVDLETGKRFTVRHLGGSNHADSEPLTAADTAVMKSLFGGQWSWNKRAILLEVGDQVLAASIAGMPHDVQTIFDNNFPGHFDIYFYNSRSHNTNAISPEHQANVLKAAGR